MPPRPPTPPGPPHMTIFPLLVTCPVIELMCRQVCVKDEAEAVPP